jgi:signal transduction histidine kinase/ActR/RegA family two-component response regulator
MYRPKPGGSRARWLHVFSRICIPVTDLHFAGPVQSLRWRIPLYVFVLVVAMLGVFLLATHREIDRTLVLAGRDRAAASGARVVDLVARAVRLAADENTRLSRDASVRALAADPTEGTRAAALRVLLPRSSEQLRRMEIWTADGARALEISTPLKTSTAVVSYPVEPAPVAEGVGPLQTAGDLVFFSMTTAIRGDDDITHLGFLRRYGRVQLSVNLKQIFGDGSTLRLGSPSGGAWTDLFVQTSPAPALLPGDDAEYRDEHGTIWVGQAQPIDGTPWIAWVGMPRAQVVAPAQSFMRRLVALSLGSLALSTVLVAVVGVRLARRLRTLTTAADQMAAGDYGQRLPVTRRDELGLLTAAFNTMADQVERAHGALRASHEQTHFALAAARVGVWESYPHTGAIACSESVAEMRGLPGSAAPRTIDEFLSLVHPDDRAAMRDVLSGQVRPDGSFEVSYRLLPLEGSTIWAMAKGRLKSDARGQPVSVMGVSIDITELRRLEAQLRQSQKIEAVGQLAGGVAHDFNNLLTAILGHGTLLLQQLPPDDARRQEATEVLAAAERATALTRQLLAFSRRQVLQPRVIGVNAVVANIQTMIRRLIGEQIQMKLSLTAAPDTTRVDPGQLEQVLVNLAVNARDAMPDGGTLTIATSTVELAETYAQQHASVVPGRYVMVSVTDTGTGMDAETQAHLFEPFFTTKAAGQGTGLGLATVYGIVKQSGGFIYPYSEPGHGSTFKIYFPATNEVPADETSTPAPVPVRGRETVLVVEDNLHVQTIATRVLASLGYEVLAASSGEEALRLLEDGRTIDLVVSDVIMPGMTGPELCRQLAERFPRLRVLFTSGYSSDAVARHGVLAPGTLFLEKPYSPSALGRKVGEALGRAEAAAPAALVETP